jgi:hypothetical protein
VSNLLGGAARLSDMGNFLSKAKTATSAASEKMSGPAAFKHYSKAQSTFKPPLIANENAYLGDIYSRSVSNLGFTTLIES